MPVDCNIHFQMLVKTTPNPTATPTYDPGLIGFEDFLADASVPEPYIRVLIGSTDNVFYNGVYPAGEYSPGQYVIEVRAFADNNFDTGVFVDLTVDVLDPCKSADLAFTADMVFKQSPEVTATQFFNYQTAQVTWDDSIVTTTITSAVDPCGAYVYELLDAQTETTLAIQEPFTAYDLTSATRSLDLFFSDSSLAGAYELRLDVHYPHTPERKTSIQFRVVMEMFCMP